MPEQGSRKRHKDETGIQLSGRDSQTHNLIQFMITDNKKPRQMITDFLPDKKVKEDYKTKKKYCKLECEMIKSWKIMLHI